MRHACSIFAVMCAATGPAHASFLVSADPTQNVACSGKTCAATARSAVLNVQDLENRLASSSVTLVSGGGAQDIVFAAPVSWTSASHLDIDARRSIEVVRAISVAGSGALALRTNHGGTGGELLLRRGAGIGFLDLSSTLKINGNSYVLVNSVATLASAVASNPSGYFALANNYDASSDGTYASPPVAQFAGTFEGLGNTISGLRIEDSAAKANVGLFAQIGVASIRDLNFQRIEISAPFGEFVGALAGLSAGGRIDHVTSFGVVSAGDKSSVGGLVGFSQSGFAHHQFFYAGISHCHAGGEVSGGKKAFAGGLVGISFGVLEFSSASASATIQGGVAGGLAGFASRNVVKSFATGATLGGPGSIAGGLIGENASEIVESYALGNSSTMQSGTAGGLVGLATKFGSTIIESYSAGQVSGNGATLGGFIGTDTSTGSNFTSHWDTDLSGITDLSQAAGNVQNDPGIIGLRDSQLKGNLPADFDPRDWAEDSSVNSGLPYLKGNRS